MRILAVSSYGELGGAELSLAAFAAHRPADVELRALLVSSGGLSELLLENLRQRPCEREPLSRRCDERRVLLLVSERFLVV